MVQSTQGSVRDAKRSSRTVVADSFGLTHEGKVRRVNQDQYLIGSIRKTMDVERSSLSDPGRDKLLGGTMAQLLLVADGVCGSAAGDKASALAVATVADHVTDRMSCFSHADDHCRDEVVKELTLAVQLSHARVRSAAEQNSELTGMATSLTAGYVLWPRADIVHVGDSRCYLMRGQQLSQITKDQTVAQRLVDRGIFTPEDLERSPFNKVLTSAIGMGPSPVTSTIELEKGDTLLLCSDGLTKHVGTQQIAEHLLASNSAEDACQRLLDTALQGGGSDNITMIVSRFGEVRTAGYQGDLSQSRSGAGRVDHERWQVGRHAPPAEAAYV